MVVRTSTSQLMSPMFVNLALPTVCARVKAIASCSLDTKRGKVGDHPVPLRKSVRYGANCLHGSELAGNFELVDERTIVWNSDW